MKEKYLIINAGSSSLKFSLYEMPDNISAVLVDPISGKPATDSSPKKKMMYFVKGTEPSNTDQTFDEKNNNYTAS